MNDNNVISALKKTMLNEIVRIADERIDELVRDFRRELESHKAEIAGRLIDRIEIEMKHDPLTRNITFQINIRGDGHNQT